MEPKHIFDIIFSIVLLLPYIILAVGFHISERKENKKIEKELEIEIKKQEAERKYGDGLLSPEQIEKRRLEKMRKEQKIMLKKLCECCQYNNLNKYPKCLQCMKMCDNDRCFYNR